MAYWRTAVILKQPHEGIPTASIMSDNNFRISWKMKKRQKEKKSLLYAFA